MTRYMRAICLVATLFVLASSAPPLRGAAPEPGVSMVVPQGEALKYWPRWRGPSGQGHVQGTGYPDTWSDKTNVLWRAPVPGAGNSSPIVWADRIFMATSYDDGQRKSIVCFRRSDGRKMWETFAPAAPPETTPYPKNGHASGTPTTDGRRIYAYLGNHGLLALDLDGRQVWHRALGPFDASHGTAGSPLLYQNRVIVFQDQQGGDGSFIAAFDAATGAPIWKTARREQVGWGTPIAIHAGDRDEIIVSSMRRVYAYDPASGRELWSAGGNLFEVIPTPVVGEGLVFCSSGRAGPTLAIKPGGSGDVTATHVVWKAAKGSPFVPSPLVHDGVLYMVNDIASIATAYDAKSGEVLWQGRLGEAARESFSASPVLVDGKVYFTNDQGETFVLAAGREFRLLHVNRLDARTIASPALVGGTWYFRTDRELVAIGARP